ncbi:MULTISPECIES: YhgE/Pip domain-containing protein [Bacillus]|uniref:YhgE/Pip domain-containing protein n=1 Tax=Bacillus cereus VD048 TaxID=1053226 RepID=J8HIV8_BACCE|nr:MULTISPECIES: ABC transporter permease [Bacillus]EEK75300.1 ABC-2 type transporter [Bacillus mycoides]EJR25101.1 YhgE/Pip domain-containing protein [Bacillus cereus VD048]MBK5426756.1 ABC transporter permease [Bacillus sp. TH30]WJE35074.1 ABC transporter permease [Bacillus mycoides]WOA63779.1 ABC transporter permease [Bacillus mycoides]
MDTLKQFLKRPGTYVGMVVALSFQLIFFCVWLTAYDGVNERADQMRIAIVNEDGNIGSKIVEGLQRNLPFQVKKEQSMERANEEMNDHVYDMIIEIPASFSKDINETGKTNLNFHINQANAMMAKQMMEGAAKQIRDNVNKEIASYKKQAIVGKLQAIGPENVEVIKGLTGDSISFTVHKVNDAKGFSVNMVPLMIVLASFVGAMIMSMELSKVAKEVKEGWSNFVSRQIINGTVSILLACITIGLMKGFQIEMHETVGGIWVFQAIVFFAFLSLTQMFITVFGNAGMIFNIISLSLQLVSSGVIVPHEMLSKTYQTIGELFPATYAANGYYTIIFGGVNLEKNIISLLFIILVTQLVAGIAIVIKGMAKGRSSVVKEA